MIRRNWKDAEGKRVACVVCGATNGVELAHVWAREADKFLALDEGYFASRARTVRTVLRVSPLRVVALCGPATDPTTCHGKYDDHRLDLSPYLTAEEAAQAVLDAGSLENARIRISGSRTDPEAA